MYRVALITAFGARLGALLENAPSFAQPKRWIAQLYIVNCGEGVAGDISCRPPGAHWASQ
jgi:hypothetical protein